eukprot:6182815-Pleurochrysis_carterae.AAC.5
MACRRNSSSSGWVHLPFETMPALIYLSLLGSWTKREQPGMCTLPAEKPSRYAIRAPCPGAVGNGSCLENDVLSAAGRYVTFCALRTRPRRGRGFAEWRDGCWLEMRALRRLKRKRRSGGIAVWWSWMLMQDSWQLPVRHNACWPCDSQHFQATASLWEPVASGSLPSSLNTANNVSLVCLCHKWQNNDPQQHSQALGERTVFRKQTQQHVASPLRCLSLLSYVLCCAQIVARAVLCGGARYGAVAYSMARAGKASMQISKLPDQHGRVQYTTLLVLAVLSYISMSPNMGYRHYYSKVYTSYNSTSTRLAVWIVSGIGLRDYYLPTECLDRFISLSRRWPSSTAELV